MNTIINYYYGMEINSVKRDNDAFVFSYNNNLYYFVPYIKHKKNLNDFLEMYTFVKNKNIICHEIILNKFNNVLTEFNNFTYILLKVNKSLNKEIDIFDMINNNEKCRLNNINKLLDKFNWINKWELNVEYYKDQIKNYGYNKKELLNSFSYYMGLAENSIEYLSYISGNVKFDDAKDYFVISRRRIFSPNYLLNYANPICFVVDLEVRDYAEYFKSLFFDGGDVYQEIVSFLKRVRVGSFSLSVFFARLIYPSYYFDLFEKVILNDESSDILINILNKQEDYNKFLNFVYKEILKYTPIKKIPWLVL